MSSRSGLFDPSTRTVLFVAAAAFLLCGGMASLYGPLFPELRQRFGVGVDEVGAVVSAHFLGSFTMIVLSSSMIKRWGYRTVILVGLITLMAGLAVLALAGQWWLVIAGAGIGGLGFGLLNVSINLVVARAFAADAAPALNLINAIFGGGAMLTPLMVAAFAPRFAPPLVILISLCAVVLLLATRLVAPPPAPPVRGGAPVAWALVTGFIVLYFMYVTSEVGVASWVTEYLTPSVGLGWAAGATSIYWGAVTLGRILAVPVSARVKPGAMVIGSLTVALCALVAAHWIPVAPVAFAVVGLGLAPVFPTGLAWLNRAMPLRAEQLTPVALAAANLGPVATAPLIGMAVLAWGVSVIPSALAAAVVLALASALWLRSRTGP
ncbi:MAG TPA: MFS transporter [Trueperaceae bacterium]|nr:MFS transporter [Trueperaceae bacterium]